MWPYILQEKETLSDLATRFNTRVTALEATNPGISFIPVKPGQAIHIPGSPLLQQYEILEGDDLASISAKFKTESAYIRALNPHLGEELGVGQVVNVPDTSDCYRRSQDGRFVANVEEVEGLKRSGESSKSASSSDTLQVPELDPRTNLLYVPKPQNTGVNRQVQTLELAVERGRSADGEERHVVFIKSSSGAGGMARYYTLV